MERPAVIDDGHMEWKAGKRAFVATVRTAAVS